MSAPAVRDAAHNDKDFPFEPNDHALWRLLRKRFAATVPMSAVALELGVTADALCRWIMAYREPRPPKPYQSPRLPALPQRLPPALPVTVQGRGDPWTLSADDRRQLIWDRARTAARQAREHLP